MIKIYTVFSSVFHWGLKGIFGEVVAWNDDLSAIGNGFKGNGIGVALEPWCMGPDGLNKLVGFLSIDIFSRWNEKCLMLMLSFGFGRFCRFIYLVVLGRGFVGSIACVIAGSV